MFANNPLTIVRYQQLRVAALLRDAAAHRAAQEAQRRAAPPKTPLPRRVWN